MHRAVPFDFYVIIIIIIIIIIITIIIIIMIIMFKQDDHFSYKNCYQYGSCIKINEQKDKKNINYIPNWDTLHNYNQ